MNEKKRPTNDKGQPTTGGEAPGGQATGMRHDEFTAARSAPPTTVGRGGAAPVAPAGGSGDSAGGLAEGPGNLGGTRNLAHGAGRPGLATSEGLPPQGVDSPLDVDKQQLPDDAAGTKPTLRHEVAQHPRAT